MVYEDDNVLDFWVCSDFDFEGLQDNCNFCIVSHSIYIITKLRYFNLSFLIFGYCHRYGLL